MMRKFAKILLKTVLWIAAAVMVITVVMQLLLSPAVATRIVNRHAPKFVDADLTFGRASVSLFRHFPYPTLQLDDAVLTYPSDRFHAEEASSPAAFLMKLGKGEQEDTLASFSHFEASLNPFALLSQTVSIPFLALESPRIYAKYYSEGKANWQVFKFDSDSSSSSVPPMHLGTVSLSGRSCVVFSSPSDTLFATLRFRRMNLGGSLKTDELATSSATFAIDSLSVAGRYVSDTLLFALENLRMDKLSRNMDLSADAATFLATREYGRLRIPISLDANLLFPEDSLLAVDIASFNASVAHAPMHARGLLRFDGAAVYTDLKAEIPSFRVQTIADEYRQALGNILKDVITDAEVDMNLSARGWYGRTEGEYPSIRAAFHVPPCELIEKIGGRSIGLAADINAESRVSKGRTMVDVCIDSISANCAAFGLNLCGDILDVLGKDPIVSPEGNACIHLDKLSAWFPEAGVKADGDVNVEIGGSVRLSQLSTEGLARSDLWAEITSAGISAHMPLGDSTGTSGVVDSLFARTAGFSARLAPKKDHGGLCSLEFRGDTISVALPGEMRVRTSGMKSTFSLAQRHDGDRVLPVLSVDTRNARFALRTPEGRVFMRDLSLNFSATKNIEELKRRSPSRPRPDEFRGYDMNFKLDETLADYYRDWNIDGGISLRRASLVTPYFPLRSSLSALDAKFTSNVFSIDSVTLNCGRSSMSMNGRASGLRRTLLSNAPVDLRLALHSEYLNLSELLSAYVAGSGYELSAFDSNLSDSDFDAKMAADTLAADTSLGETLLVVPGNVNANISLRADSIDYSTMHIRSATAALAMKNRCLQILDAKAESNMGLFAFNAFYSTRSRSDIKAGFDMKLKDVAAHQVIDLMPAVDTLLPMIKGFSGNINCMIAATADLDTMMNVMLPTASGVVRIEGDDLKIKDSEDYRKIAKMLMFKNRKEGSVEHLRAEAVLADGRMEIFPFVANIDQYKVAFSGVQQLDMSFKYHVSVLHSPVPFRFGVDVKGKDFDNWNFKIGKAKFKNENVPVFSEVVDEMQLNLSTSIRNVFRKGVETVLRENRSMAPIHGLKRRIGYVPADEQSLESLSEEETRVLQENEQ